MGFTSLPAGGEVQFFGFYSNKHTNKQDNNNCPGRFYNKNKQINQKLYSQTNKVGSMTSRGARQSGALGQRPMM